jgi:tetratricopeptide (TPR) repeat protein
MNRSFWILTAALMGTNIALVQQTVVAKSPVEVGQIAKSITVEIKAIGSDKVGSGILLQQQGDVYTVLTARHVIEKDAEFNLKTKDGEIHKSMPGSVKLAGSSLDLGVLKFKSSKKYNLTKIGSSENLQELSTVYVAGFPAKNKNQVVEHGIFQITPGFVLGIGDKGNNIGYSLIYNNLTFSGMSGGPVLNEAGELVAIHGQGEPALDNNIKSGRNLGIIIERFGTVALEMGVKLEVRIAPVPQRQSGGSTDDVIRGKDKYYQGDIQGALADFNLAIAKNPKGISAYIYRANLRESKLGDAKGAFADYSQVIAINPTYIAAYVNRGWLNDYKLNNAQGALTDYTQAITLNPEDADVYMYRAKLKQLKLNDMQGALADYNQAIRVSPKYTTLYVYRGGLKHYLINDPQGALADYSQAIILDPKYIDAYMYRAFLKAYTLGDTQGALADYSQAINIDPKYTIAYMYRARLKENRTKDVEGAVTDYGQIISIDPKYVDAYVSRAKLRKEKLNDRVGAIEDYRQAAKLYREQGKTKELQLMLDNLRQLRSTE